MSTEEATSTFNHPFLEEHDFNGTRRRFGPDNFMAQSIQRPIDTAGALPHGLALFKHETLEASYMAEGMSQKQAHDGANRRYDYQSVLMEWLGGERDV